MKTYLLALIAASVFGAVCTSLAGSAFEKHMKYICSLVCVCLMLLPLRGLIGIDLSEAYGDAGLAGSAPDADTLALEAAEERAGQYVAGLVFERFGIKPTETRIKIRQEPGGAAVEEIVVVLPDGGIVAAAEEYLKNELGDGVTVVEG